MSVTQYLVSSPLFRTSYFAGPQCVFWQIMPKGWQFKLDAKSGPLESGDFGKIANLDGKKSPEGWRFKLDGKSGPLKSCDFDNGSFVL